MKAENEESGIATAELNNRLLHPLQQLKVSINQSVSIAQIYQLQTETAVEQEEESLDARHKAHAEVAKLQQAEPAPAPAAEGNTGGDSGASTKAPNNKPAAHTSPRDKAYDPNTATAPASVNAPKPVARVRVSDLLCWCIAASTGKPNRGRCVYGRALKRAGRVDFSG
mgnify:CR=1 FL=1